MEALEAAPEKTKRQEQVTNSMNPPEAIGPSCFVNFNPSTSRNIVDGDVEHQVVDFVDESVTAAVEQVVIDLSI